MTDSSSRPDTDAEQPLIAHLAELRNRLLRSLVCVFVIFLGLSVFANDIYAMIAGPLLAQLPEESSMIATEVAAPFLVPFKLTFFAARIRVCALPVVSGLGVCRAWTVSK